MRNSGRGLILLILLSIALIVLFLWLPRQPEAAREREGDPVDADSLKLMQAIELVNGDNPMQGILMLRELVEKDSLNAQAQYWLGVFAVKSGQYDKAISRFETVIRLTPGDVAPYIDLGGVYLELDSAEKALVFFEKGIGIDSTNNYALLFAAQAEEKLGRLEAARSHYEQLLRHNSDTVVTRRVNEFIERIHTTLKNP